MRFKCLDCRRKGPAKELKPTYLNGEVCPRCKGRNIRFLANDGLSTFERAALLYGTCTNAPDLAISLAQAEEGLALRQDDQERALYWHEVGKHLTTRGAHDDLLIEWASIACEVYDLA